MPHGERRGLDEEKEKLSVLQNAVRTFVDIPGNDIAAALQDSTTIVTRLDSGQQVNTLSGLCIKWLDALKEHLHRNGIKANIVSSKNDKVHSFLQYMDHGTEMIIDPTLGQFVEYPHIFVGTRDQLRTVFMDPKRNFLSGTKIWSQEEEITSREEWFRLLYTT